MAINKKLISFATQAQFDVKLNAGDIDNRSIVFIEDKKRIWTHGVYFDTSWDYVGNTPNTIEGYNIIDAASKINSLYYVVGNTSGTAGAWTGTVPEVTSLYAGLTIAYKIGVAGASTTNLNLNGLGNKLVRRNTSNLTTHLPVGTVVLLTYDGTRWVWADYHANTTYAAMSVAEGKAGTVSTLRTMRADYLKQIVEHHIANTAPSDHTLASHSDVSITSNSTGEILKWNGSRWINNTLAEAGIASTSQLSNYLPLTGGTISGLITSTTSNTSAAFYKSSSTGTAFARIGASTHDKGFGVSNTGEFIFGDWSGVSSLSTNWNKIWHSGNLANGTTSQYIRGDGSLATYTTYSLMSLAELNTGTATTNRVVNSKNLNDWLNPKLALKATPADISTAIDDIEIGGRNLIVLGDLEVGRYLVQTTGAISSSSSHAASGFIKAEALTEYIYSGRLGVQQVRFIAYDSNKTFISGVLLSGYQGDYSIYKTPANTEFIRISADFTTRTHYNEWKLEKGNKATDWTPAPEDQVSDWNTTDVTSFSYIKNKPTTFAPSAHSHGPITNDGKIGTLANRIIETTTGGLLTHVAKNTAYNKAFGTTAGTVAQGNDSRINNGQTAFGWGNFKTYGLGTTAGAVITDDMNTPVTNALFSANASSPTNSPTGQSYPMGINFYRSGAVRAQISIGHQALTGIAYRGYSGSWKNWVRVWDENSLTKLTQLTNDLPNFTRTVAGLVPAPGASTTTRYLREDGTWVTPPNTPDTHWTTGIRAGASGTNANSAADDPFIKVLDNTTYRSQIQILGGTNITATSDATGKITIDGTHNHDTRYKRWYRDQGVDVDANRKENTYLSGYRWINTPIDGIGILETNNQYSNDWVTQEFTRIVSQPRKFIRSFHSGNTWGSWFEFWHSGNLTKVSQLSNDSEYITASASITGNAATASAVSTSAENTGTTSRYILFANSASGNQALKTDSGLRYVPSTNTISATFSGNLTGNVTGNSDTATNLKNINTTFTGEYPLTVNVNGTIYSHTGMTYKGSTGELKATTFVGDLSGNATSSTTATTASKLTINSSASASWFDILWNSGTTVYGSASNKLRVQPSTGSITSGGTITASSFSGDLTGKADSVLIKDTRGDVRLPSYYTRRAASWDFQQSTYTGAGGDTWNVVNTISKWSSFSTAHRQEQIAYTGASLKHRVATSDTVWGAWKTILDSSNSSVSGNTITINGTSTTWVNTHRGIQNNLTSTSTVDSLSAAQGRLLANGSARDSTKLPLTGGTLTGSVAGTVFTLDRYIPSPQGGRYTTSTTSVTGAIKITLPLSWNSTMLRFAVDVYNYSTNTSFTVYVGGYNYNSGSWINTFAYILARDSGSDYTVRFGHDGSKCCVYIGETNKSWAYPQIVVKDVHLGYSGGSNSSWGTGWSIGFATSFGTISSTISDCMVYSRYAKTSGSATALTTSAGSATQPVYFSGGKPVATTYSLGKSVPSNAVFTDTNTHYTTRLYAGTSGTATNTVLSNPYIKVTDDNTYRNQIQLYGGSNVTVASDVNGRITITATNTNTTYTTGTLAQLNAGTDTTGRLHTAKNLNDWLNGKGYITSYVDTNSVTGITAGASGTTTNAAVTSPYIKVKDDSTHRSQIRLVGGTNTSVSSNSSGTITISSTDTVYTHPTTAGNKHIPSGGAAGQFLKWSASGTAVWAADNNTVYTHPTTAGNKHIPSGGATGQILRWSSNGTAVWSNENTGSSYSHPTGDGNLHVPATGTSNSGKVLKAGSTAGSLSWGTLGYADVGAASSGHTHTNMVTTNTSQSITATKTFTSIVIMSSNLSVNGTITGYGNITAPGFFQSSDIRLKNVIKPLKINIKDILNIPSFYFTYKDKDNKRINIGTSAQEVQKVFPEIINTDSKGMLSVEYDKFGLIALDLIKTQQKEIDSLKYELNNLKLKIDGYRN